MDLDKLKITKSVVKFVVRTSVGAVAWNVVKEATTTETKVDKIRVTVGSYVLAAIVADYAVDWAADKFDTTLEKIQGVTSPDPEETPISK